ncbi:DUF4862 family protein [Microbacterium panaciterrae]|uniref:DUF4862 family protein n=1 Tax=Microbacterium panaciterrae TaxID=985759 RepID=A0ABP8PV11_9MICO
MLVGAYAASPAHARWDPRAEAEFFDGLDGLDDVGGLELPWLGSLHPHDDAWLLAHFPRRFDAVLTSIPGTMVRLRDEPRFGLASTDEEGRAAAVREALAIRDGARRIDDATGRATVRAIALHSAPTRTGDARGSAEALRMSLLELLDAGGWDETALVIEHCDAAVPGHPAEKGFLAVDDELAALEDFPDAVGMSVNWGRSAIELRDPDLVSGQIARIAGAGRLHGLMLSGASAQSTPFGGSWADAHHPLAPAEGFPIGEPASLLTLARARSAIAAAGSVRWSGVKFGWADHDAAVAPRLAMIAAAARLFSAGPG